MPPLARDLLARLTPWPLCCGAGGGTGGAAVAWVPVWPVLLPPHTIGVRVIRGPRSSLGLAGSVETTSIGCPTGSGVNNPMERFQNKKHMGR